MAWVCVVWISLFPFIMLYGAYEGPKVWWLWIGGFALSLWWIMKGKTPRITWLLVWIIFLLASSVLGIHPLESIIGGGYRHQGVLFFLTLFLIGQTIPFFSNGSKKMLDTALVWGVMLESSIVIVQKIIAWPMRPMGTFGEPNAVAGFLAIGLFWVMRTKKTFWAIIVCVAIFATGSRTGIGAMCIVLSAFLSNKHAMILVSITAVSVLCIGFFRPSSLYENRTLFWNMAVKAIQMRPVLGYGAESSETVFNNIFVSEHIRLFDFIIERSHNIFLDVAMWSGLAGLIVFGRWVLEIMKQSKIRWAVTAWFLFACIQPVGVVHWIQLMLLTSLYSDPPASSRGGS